MISKLICKGIGFKEEEEFARHEETKLKGGGGFKKKKEFVALAMRAKLDDNEKLLKKLRKKKNQARKKLEVKLGVKSRICKVMIREEKENNLKIRRAIQAKNNKKVEFLVNKYGDKAQNDSKDLLGEDYAKYEGARIFRDVCGMVADKLKGPVVISCSDDTIEINENEKAVLSLGPKFCILSKLCEENCQNHNSTTTQPQDNPKTT